MIYSISVDNCFAAQFYMYYYNNACAMPVHVKRNLEGGMNAYDGIIKRLFQSKYKYIKLNLKKNVCPYRLWSIQLWSIQHRDGIGRQSI